MKVLLINGSPHANGSTYTALSEVEKALHSEGIETEIFQIGAAPIAGCMGCLQCAGLGKCVLDDAVNQCREKAAVCDGFVFGSPVYFASAAGALTAFMDRLFFSDLCAETHVFYLKPAASVVVARRSGATGAFDQLNKYFSYNQMLVVSSQSWNLAYGCNADEVLQDIEGMQTMRILGRNMAFFLKCKEAGLKAGIPLPAHETPIDTNFIR